MTLNRNPDSFFAETEQVAFHLGHVVPGIDFTNDPLLQGRLFSYLDTQLSRLGGPNFAQIPINRPLAPVANNQRDGFHQDVINQGKASYYPNSTGNGCPMTASELAGGYVSFPAMVEGPKVRARSDSFKDYFSQATLFWKSLSPTEQDHVVAAAHFELGKVNMKEIRERMVALYTHVDPTLAQRIAEGIGVSVPTDNPRPGTLPPSGRPTVEKSAALSMENTVKNTIKGRQVAILAADGVDDATVQTVKNALMQQGAQVKVVSRILGTLKGTSGQEVPVDKSAITTDAIMFDAVFVPGGEASVAQLLKQGAARQFVAEAFKHGKAIGAVGEGIQLLYNSNIPGLVMEGKTASGTASSKTHATAVSSNGVVTAPVGSNLNTFVEQFTTAIAQHRHWGRPQDQVPA